MTADSLHPSLYVDTILQYSLRLSHKH